MFHGYAGHTVMPVTFAKKSTLNYDNSTLDYTINSVLIVSNLEGVSLYT